ncbi:GNAT family N-acetyltransferase [Streptococcus sp. DD12]|uniref:GNAT family N-acetyltransferase n=1 Tax=Streptococcus sp. DD12 TaxID=1777880 RepID=UPI00079C3A5D|nr:N-acetyltransferase [Streptococcus sp. DD12]KXT76235.1 acetyltransferase, GNAT family [Streptococcus sp. DD12]
MSIRHVKLSEIPRLSELAKTTYTETFGYANTAEQLEAYYAKAYAHEVLMADLLDPESETFFLFHEGQLAGYLKVNWGQAQTEQDLPDGFEIQRLYIRQAFQGHGLGQKLFGFALDLAKERGFDWAWLGVWEANEKAQAFYRKQGFERFGQHVFLMGDKVDVNWLLKKRLT